MTRAFVAEGVRAAERAKTGYRPTADFHPDMVHGFCGRCKLVGAVSYGTLMKIRQMDRLMDRKPVTFENPICPKCGGREFVPLDLKGPQRDSLEVVRMAENGALRILKEEP
jgi:ribosomal protein S27AE